MTVPTDDARITSCRSCRPHIHHRPAHQWRCPSFALASQLSGLSDRFTPHTLRIAGTLASSRGKRQGDFGRIHYAPKIYYAKADQFHFCCCELSLTLGFLSFGALRFLKPETRVLIRRH